MKACLLPLLLGLLSPSAAWAQCSSTISAFPYQEGFEAAAAWTSGGTSDDWAWGSPSKPVISSAAGGSKAWVVGGLTGSFYAFGEQSWLESPCFDFSALPYPYIAFKLFWECERTYDGLGFQYSVDGGSNWSNVGAANEPDDCTTQNWFNTVNITNLNLAAPRAGWSGRIGPTQGSCAGGQGSAGWVTASHCLAFLAGEPSVKFRFVFGAGTTCNNYDGIAVDDIYIGEAPALQDAVQFACFADTIEIQNADACAVSWFWDFGDPASGSGNTSSLATPTHVFSGPGSYDMTFTRTFECRSPITVTLVVDILGLEITATDPSCDGTAGSIAAVVTNAPLPPTFVWTPGGFNTPTITGLNAGTYLLNVTGGGFCPTGATITLDPPPNAPTVEISSISVTCNGFTDGSATVVASGGTPPYSYSWSPSSGTAATASGLSAGSHDCTVTDASGCSTTVDVAVNEPEPVLLVAQDDAALCLGDGITLQATASGGTPGFNYDWSPDGPDVSPNATTIYTITATDANGCTSAPDEVEVSIGSVATPTFTVSDTMGCSPHCASFIARQATGVFVWDFGDGTTLQAGEAVSHCYADGGIYTVSLSVTDDGGCSGSWTLTDAVDVIQSPQAAFVAVPPVTTIKDPVFRFINQSAGADSVVWSFGEGIDSLSTEVDATYTYDSVACYSVRLLAFNANGCASSSEAVVCVEDEFAVYIPNAFTPNDDGFNDTWGVITTVGSPRDYELILFDRWGQELFRSSRKEDLWDGAGYPEGVYPWRLHLRDTEGRNQERTGHVTLLR
ncbi:MAG: gliding motility-associated C-terminal domain-containing protein [Flavobacteriales bacterium]|nr:gliding motility-associated C-terminal domain-containing protein [Flavobacteriales bacterium]